MFPCFPEFWASDVGLDSKPLFGVGAHSQGEVVVSLFIITSESSCCGLDLKDNALGCDGVLVIAMEDGQVVHGVVPLMLIRLFSHFAELFPYKTVILEDLLLLS